jgi:hypothetical protein
MHGVWGPFSCDLQTERPQKHEGIEVKHSDLALAGECS